MKNRVIHAELNREQTRALHGRLPLNLQLFADGDDDGADGDDGGDDGDDADDEDGEEDNLHTHCCFSKILCTFII